MDNITEIMTAISTVGFPIVACVAMYYINWKTQQMHKEEIGKITEAIHNNTVALTKLVDKLEGVNKHD